MMVKLAGPLWLVLAGLPWWAAGSAPVTGEPVVPRKGGAESALSQPLTDQQQKDMVLLADVLRDSRIDEDKRRQAAASLLARRWPQADSLLAGLMVQADDPSTPRLIAQALATMTDPPQQLVEPLFGLLGHEQATVRQAAAAALGRYETKAVLNRLIQVARNRQAPLTSRLAAIDALAEQYQAKAVGALVDLAEPTWQREIREQAMRRLAQTTGISQFGLDASAWRQWWEQVKNLPPQRWLSGMLQSLSRRKAELEADRQRMLDKMTETYNRLYRATEATQRPALLIEMLSEAYGPVRLLAMRIVERQLINAEPISPQVRQAIREHLIDPVPSVREAAAKVMRDLGDEPSAKVAAEHLSGEQDLAVRQAYLALLTRVPQRQAVEPVLALAERQAANGAAAGFLVAAEAAGMLDAGQRHRALAFARRLLAQGGKQVEVPVVQLLGRLAEPADRPVLIRLMKQGQPAVRQAAAEPFVSGRFDPAPLLEYFGDPVLGSKAIEAAAAHGRTVAMIEQLLAHEPTGGEMKQAWTGAVVAIAKRLELADLVKVDALLAGSSQHQGLRRLVLATAVPGADRPIDSPTRAALLVSLTEMYLANGQATEARALAERLVQVQGLEGELADRLTRVRVAAMLGSGDVEGALTVAGQWLGRNAQAGPTVAALLLEAVERDLESKKTDRAALLLARLQQMVGPLADGQLVERLNRARKRLQQMQSSPAGGSPAPAPEGRAAAKGAPGR